MNKIYYPTIANADKILQLSWPMSVDVPNEIGILREESCLGLAAQSVDEGSVGEEALLIFGGSQLSEQLLHIPLGDLITEVGQQVLKLSNHHGAVAVFVVQLQQLNVVVVVARGVGGILGLGDLGDNVVKLGELLALLISLS